MEHQTSAFSDATDEHHNLENMTNEMRDPSAILNNCRPEIEEMFHQGFKIKDMVRTVKNRHGVSITEKMCKDRLSKWGLKKKISKHDVVTMVRKQNERRHFGKKTVFKVHGKEISLQKLGPYWQRYIRSIEDQPVQMQDLPSTPTDMTCLTPPPIAIAAPDEMNYHHQLLRSVQDYCRWNFDAGFWVMRSDRRCGSSNPTELFQNQVYSSFTTARQLALTGKYAQARKTLESSSPAFVTMVLSRDPSVIAGLFDVLNQTDWNLNRETFAVISQNVRHVTREAERFFETQNPLCLILEYLSNENLRFDDLYKKLWKCMVDNFFNELGYGCSTTVNMMFDYHQEVLIREDSSAAIASQKQLIQKCQSIYGAGSRVAFNARTTLTECLLTIQRTQEAEDQQLQALSELDLSRDPDLIGYYTSGFQCLARLQKLNGKPDLAEATVREAYRNCLILCGKTSRYTLRALLRLKDFLVEIQRLDSIDEVDADIADIIAEQEQMKQAETQPAAGITEQNPNSNG